MCGRPWPGCWRRATSGISMRSGVASGKATARTKRWLGIGEGMADSIADHRFVPYIQLHEFEALLLCDPPKIAEEYFEYEEQVRLLESSLSAFRGPEWVNDHRQTAPSKRLEKHVPAYDKRLGGPRIAQAIGLATLRERCPHFGEWLGKLETLGQQGPA